MSNGMTFYVRHNRQPRSRAELRIAIKVGVCLDFFAATVPPLRPMTDCTALWIFRVSSVGSVMEKEEERGIAHMIEHLAFRASQSCPQEFELIKELESHGIKFGAHQNA
ncbi:unnamed protein product, partial [Discosporangium mesarthrocarpum]